MSAMFRRTFIKVTAGLVLSGIKLGLSDAQEGDLWTAEVGPQDHAHPGVGECGPFYPTIWEVRIAGHKCVVRKAGRNEDWVVVEEEGAG